MSRSVIAATLTMLVVIDAAALTEQNGSALAPILRTERAGPGVVRVVYDLRGVIGMASAVALEASDDGGQAFTGHPGRGRSV